MLIHDDRGVGIDGDHQIFQDRGVQDESRRLGDDVEELLEGIDHKIMIPHLEIDRGEKFRGFHTIGRDVVSCEGVVGGGTSLFPVLWLSFALVRVFMK